MIARHALIIAAGAADRPLDAFDGRTPLEAAVTPALDDIAARGRQGTVATIPRDLPVGRDVATLTLLGHDLRERYSGYAGVEAAGRRIVLHEQEVALRCDLVTVSQGVLRPPSSARLSAGEAAELGSGLRDVLVPFGFAVHDDGVRPPLLVTRHDWAADVRCTPLPEMIEQPIEAHAPTGSGGRDLREAIAAANEFLEAHDVNRRRRQAGQPAVNAVWIWGPGVRPRVRRFRERFGLRGACVGAVDLIRGVAVLMGWPMPEISTATGRPDTDYAAKGRSAVAALDEHDLVVVHVEAACEASLTGDAAAKLVALENIDRHIVGPLFERIRRGDRWSIGFVPDLAALVELQRFDRAAAPFCIAGSAPMGGARPEPFGESAAARGDLHIRHGWEFMEYFLRT